MSIGPNDPRPDDMAELARLTAIELRKRGIWARVSEGQKGVMILGNPADTIPWRVGYYYDMACKAEWTPLGPVAIAEAILSLEVVRAQEWAGDK